MKLNDFGFWVFWVCWGLLCLLFVVAGSAILLGGC
jgi:hypothetical protein